jgi:KipI family sensor histidine kinase inhibitor
VNVQPSSTSPADQIPRVVPFGDGALLLLIGDQVDPALSRRVHDLADALRAQTADDSGWGVPIPGYGSLLLPYDPLLFTQADATVRLERLLASPAIDATPARDSARTVVDIPVRYGGDDGPDLNEIADTLGLTPRQVIELHAGSEYEVLLLGFAPGFAYLGLLPPQLAIPRRATPRTRVPAGSVAIAGRQTAVYPSATAGGWHVVGRTELVMWNISRESPALLRPGQRVRFHPVRN